ncbi:MAG: hypothetical protein ACPG4X_16335 [Pikeienuella sp.]
MKHQKSLEEFLDLVGRQRLQNGIGRSTQLMTRAVAEGLMPSSWYRDVRDWCVVNQFDVPDHLFKWSDGSGVAAHNKQNAYSLTENQEGGS